VVLFDLAFLSIISALFLFSHPGFLTGWSDDSIIRYRDEGKQKKKRGGALRKLLPQIDFVSKRVIDSEEFTKIVKKTFEEVDMDGNGTLNITEVYIAVLTLYTKIIPYIDTAMPPPKEQVMKLFREIDVDQSRELDFGEFQMMAKILVSTVGGRVAFEAFLKFIVGPLAATIGFTVVFWLMHLAGADMPEWLESIVSTIFLSVTMMLLTPLCHSLIDDAVQEKASDIGMQAKANSPTKDKKKKGLFSGFLGKKNAEGKKKK
jgi:hypothetical protein